MTDAIITHEDWQEAAYLYFLAKHYFKHGHGQMPPPDRIAGKLQAIVNHGRWLVECPTVGCGGAVIVSRKVLIFMCPYCANVSNGGQWYQVEFPQECQQIEVELLKRPALSPIQAANRNWQLGETIEQLKAENKRMGIK